MLNSNQFNFSEKADQNVKFISILLYLSLTTLNIDSQMKRRVRSTCLFLFLNCLKELIITVNLKRRWLICLFLFVCLSHFSSSYLLNSCTRKKEDNSGTHNTENFLANLNFNDLELQWSTLFYYLYQNKNF